MATNDSNREFLAQLLSECDDKRELWDKLITFAGELLEEEDNYITELEAKLDELEVQWCLPDYQIINSRVVKENPNVRTLNGYRKDKIDSKEKDRIFENWTDLVKKLKIENKPQYFARWRTKDKQRARTSSAERVRCLVTAHLARGLQRTLHQVYIHFATTYGYPIKGPYQGFELKWIKIFFENSTDNVNVTRLSRILGREPRHLYNLRKKFEPNDAAAEDANCKSVHDSLLKEKKRSSPIEWSLKQINHLVDCLIKHSNLKFNQLLDAKHEIDVWKAISEDMDNVPVRLIQDRWYRKVHVQLFARKPIVIPKLIKKIFEVLSDYRYRMWTDIRWETILQHFPSGYTKEFLKYQCYDFLGRQFPSYLTKRLKKVIKFVANYNFPESRVKVLNLLRYENGVVTKLTTKRPKRDRSAERDTSIHTEKKIKTDKSPAKSRSFFGSPALSERSSASECPSISKKIKLKFEENHVS